jgi:hypothetical protein
MVVERAKLADTIARLIDYHQVDSKSATSPAEQLTNANGAGKQTVSRT